ncbi:hypothetical protein CR51_19950 [Caballeronia megalochromosomata]|nr:hypothetical protein CR51_19950 [Caballeronia megalochromosomata]
MAAVLAEGETVMRFAQRKLATVEPWSRLDGAEEQSKSYCDRRIQDRKLRGQFEARAELDRRRPPDLFGVFRWIQNAGRGNAAPAPN